MLNIICWKWKNQEYRTQFNSDHVNTLYSMICRNTTIPFNFFCITDDSSGIDSKINIFPIWKELAKNYGTNTKPNCYRRLKIFSSEIISILGSKLVSIDLDCVITNNIDSILKNSSDLAIWKQEDSENPCNGSLIIHKSGSREDIWNSFNENLIDNKFGITKLNPLSTNCKGSDQGWIGLNLNGTEYLIGKKDGVFSFRLDIKNKFYNDIPNEAKIIFFNGMDKPWNEEIVNKYSWIKKFYY